MAQYPGHDTEFFFVTEGVPSGPVKGLTELARYNVTPDTPVWYEGLTDWTPAIMAPLTRQLFEPNSEYYKALAAEETGAGSDAPGQVIPEIPPSAPKAENPSVSTPTAQPVHPYAQPMHAEAYTENGMQTVQKPKSYMVWSVVVTIFCNMIAGIVAIIFSWKVNTKFIKGDLEGAQRCSERAQWWIIISICVGLIAIVANIFTGQYF